MTPSQNRLLDVVEIEDLQVIADDLSRFHRDNRENLETRREGLSADRPFLCRPMSEHIFRVDRRLNAVEEFVNDKAICPSKQLTETY